jgi:hypothetical protein
MAAYAASYCCHDDVALLICCWPRTHKSVVSNIIELLTAQLLTAYHTNLLRFNTYAILPTTFAITAGTGDGLHELCTDSTSVTSSAV